MIDGDGDGDGDGNLLYQQKQLHPRKFHTSKRGLDNLKAKVKQQNCKKIIDGDGDADADGNPLSQQEQLDPRKFHASNRGLATGRKLKRQNATIDQCSK